METFVFNKQAPSCVVNISFVILMRPRRKSTECALPHPRQTAYVYKFLSFASTMRAFEVQLVGSWGGDGKWGDLNR